MDVPRFVTVEAVEKEPIRATNTGDRRQDVYVQSEAQKLALLHLRVGRKFPSLRAHPAGRVAKVDGTDRLLTSLLLQKFSNEFIIGRFDEVICGIAAWVDDTRWHLRLDIERSLLLVGQLDTHGLAPHGVL